jgi:hypothetical protein
MIPTERGWIGGYVREGDGALLPDSVLQRHTGQGLAAPLTPSLSPSGRGR